MTQSVHIIKSQEYQIGLSDQQESYKFQSAISSLQKSRIQTLLNDVLNKFDIKDAIYQFNSITLDLGTIKRSNYENELVYRIEEELTKYLSYTIREDGSLREGKTIQINNRMLEDLEYFLQYGHLQWHSSHSKNPIGVFKNLLSSNPKALCMLLKNRGKERRIRNRLIYQFDDDTLEEIVNLVAKDESRYIISYKKDILDIQQKQKLVKAPYHSFKTVIWEIVLSYVFAADRSYHDKKSFLQHLIKNIAEKYAISYQSLLKILFQMVKIDKHILLENKGFKKIITELTTTQQLDNKSGLNTIAKRKKNSPEHFEQVILLLGNHTFKDDVLFRSKEAFNAYLFEILRSPTALVISHLNQWLCDTSKKKRLLEMASPQCLNQIIEVSTISSIKVAHDFIKVLGRNSVALSLKTKDFLQSIQRKKAGLILNLVTSQKYNERELIHQLLGRILDLSSPNEDVFTQLLQETKPQFSKKHQKIIDQFLIDFYQNFGGIVLESISAEISNYITSNDVKLWAAWLDDKMPTWIASTRLSQPVILRYIEKHLHKTKASPELQDFINDAHNFNLKTAVKALKKKASTTHSKTLDTSTRHEGLINYILEHGQLPWWLESRYSWDQFNSDFQQQWAANKVEFLGTVKKNVGRLSFATMLDDDNLLLIWEAIVGKNDGIVLLKGVHDFINTHLRSIGLMSAQEYLKVKDDLLVLLLKSSSTDRTQKLIQHLKTWSHTTTIKSKTVLSEVFKILLRKVSSNITDSALKKELGIWIDEFTNPAVTNIKEQSLPATITAFLNNLQTAPLNLKSDVDAFKELNQILRYRPEQFDALVQKSGFRECLIKALSEKELIQLIAQKTQGNQQQLYSQAVQQLYSYKAEVSMQQYQTIYKTVFSLLLLKIGSGGLQSWGLKDWSYLVFHCLTQVLGKLKTKQILVRIKEKLSINNEVELEEYQAFIFHLNTLTNDGAKEGVKIVKKKYDDISEITIINKNLNEADIIKSNNRFILKKISANQMSFYQQGLRYLERYTPYISAKKYMLIRQLFTNILVSKLNEGAVRLWEVKDWSDLLFYSINEVIGKEKNKKLFFSITEKHDSENKVNSKGSAQFIEQLQLLVNAAPEKTVIRTKNKEEASSYKKLGEESPREFLDPIFINNAGLIILAPYLGVLFEKCGLMKDSIFKDDDCKYKGVQLLAYAASGTSDMDEQDLIINKVLCGLEITAVVQTAVELDDTDKATVDSLLNAVTQQWSALKETSIEGLRSSFLQREGRLEEEGNQFFLRVEQKAFDMLLDQIPWNITKIKLSWMQKILEVIWRT